MSATHTWLSSAAVTTAPVPVGTCEIGNDTFGTIVSGTLKRENEEIDLKDCCGSTYATLLKNGKWTLSLKAEFKSSASLPTDGGLISFPLTGGVSGFITGFQIDWERDGLRQISIEAKAHDAMGSVPARSVLACS